MDEWISPLTDLAILFALGALGGLGAMFSLQKKITVSMIGEAIFKYGSYGAGAGIIVIANVGKAIAAGISLLIGAGIFIISKIDISSILRRVLGADGTRNSDDAGK